MSEVTGQVDVVFPVAELAALVGEARLATSDEALNAHLIDGLRPRAVVTPGSAAEVGQVLAWATARSLAVSPWGGGTKQGLGRPLRRLDLVLKTSGLARILDLDEGNLTAEVEAGVPLGVLRAELAARGLFLALDPLDGDGATIGGIIACNASGPRRLLYRTARDHVLGLDVVLADGRMLHAGGKTVKDVAGYNLVKPLIGSLGTLGVIVAATVRLQPGPESVSALVARFADLEAVQRFALAVRATQLLPAALEVVSENAWALAGGGSLLGAGAVVLCGLEGAREAVARHERDLATLAQSCQATAVSISRDAEAAAVWASRQQVAAALAAAVPGLARARVGVPLAVLGEALRVAEREAARRGLGVAYAGHAGNGLAQVNFTGADAPLAEALLGLRQSVERLGGYLLLEIAPSAVKARVEPLPARDDYALMQRIRESLNPGDVLNPGKLF
ncbi:MAG: FAD-binding oxidoreductase [Chloroflexota bacterium]